MAKTLRVLTRTGWTTKPVADTPANRLTAEEVDANFMAVESEALHPVNNLSDVTSASTSRTNLELSDAATTTVSTIRSGTTATNVGLGSVDNTSDANKPVSSAQQTALNNKQIDLVSGTNIKTVNGTTLLGSGNLDALNGLATSLELQRYNETVATGSATLDRADGGIQTFTMTTNITLAMTIAASESLTFHLSAGDTYAVTWPTMTWVGGSVPTLTAADVIEFWKVGSTLYGAYVGAV